MLDLSQCALANGVCPALAAGYTPDLLHVQVCRARLLSSAAPDAGQRFRPPNPTLPPCPMLQLEESVAQCRLSETSVQALAAIRK